ncbi:MAG: metal-dependent transcriptional regulator [Imperialibacter sp.]|uniref:metal-dependent transcriptional regulator n=1 Tax=Imperialibacter sp. TaxID=2038411 RepID=UPI0032EC7218
MLSFAEENYLKAIFHLSDSGATEVSTNAISDHMNTKPASVSDMIRKLDEKGMVTYKKYYGVNISRKGKVMALQVIRKHRLWEVFLVDKLKFNWDEVHEVAEQLEHIRSGLLIQRLDEFLDYPKVDPHGDPIPDENGDMAVAKKTPLDKVEVGVKGKIVAVNDEGSSFLQYLDKIGIYLGAKLEVTERVDFDGSMEILIDNKQKVFISREVSQNILITD